MTPEASNPDIALKDGLQYGEDLQSFVMSVVEQEQERIGRELHDGLGQELAGAAFLAKALEARLARQGDAAATDAEWIKLILGRCMEEVRALSRRLSPTDLAQGNVAAALARLCKDVERSYGIRCMLSIEEPLRMVLERTNAESTRQLFRICQEALNNATKHSACDRIIVRLAPRCGQLRLSVSDNGRGFGHDSHHANKGGLGLASQRMRARSLGGECRFLRRSGWTHVFLRAPIRSFDAQVAVTSAATTAQPRSAGTD